MLAALLLVAFIAASQAHEETREGKLDQLQVRFDGAVFSWQAQSGVENIAVKNRVKGTDTWFKWTLPGDTVSYSLVLGECTERGLRPNIDYEIMFCAKSDFWTVKDSRWSDVFTFRLPYCPSKITGPDPEPTLLPAGPTPTLAPDVRQTPGSVGPGPVQPTKKPKQPKSQDPTSTPRPGGEPRTETRGESRACSGGGQQSRTCTRTISSGGQASSWSCGGWSACPEKETCSNSNTWTVSFNSKTPLNYGSIPSCEWKQIERTLYEKVCRKGGRETSRGNYIASERTVRTWIAPC